MKKRGRIFVISAPSGCGKTTICKQVVRRIKNLVPSISVTTRQPRKDERNKRDYTYISEASFKRMVRSGALVEWTENFGYFYGTPKQVVLEKINEGKNLLLSIDVKGAMRVRKRFPESVLIFIKPPSLKELSRRLKIRDTDNKKDIAKRLDRAKKEIAYIKRYDYSVINKNLESAIRDVVNIIRKERHKGGTVGIRSY